MARKAKEKSRVQLMNELEIALYREYKADSSGNSESIRKARIEVDTCRAALLATGMSAESNACIVCGRYYAVGI